MPRGKKSEGDGGPTKVSFVRSMPADMPPKEVAEKAAEQGLIMTPKNISTMRAKDRAKEKGGPKNGAKKTSGPKKVTKTSFVLALPSDLHARDVVAKAAAEGMALTEKHVATIRSAARKASGAKKSPPKGVSVKPKGVSVKKSAAKKSAAKKVTARTPKVAPVSAPKSRKSGPLSADDLLRVAVLVVGLPRATSFVEEESRKIRRLLGG